MINRKVDGIPVYGSKEWVHRKEKVLHWTRFLLWLADYGEPVRCNLMMISDTLPGMVPGQQLEDSGEGLHPVPVIACSMALIWPTTWPLLTTWNWMTSRIGREVHTDIPWQAAGQRIPDCDEAPNSDSLGSYVGDIPVSWADRDQRCPHNCVPGPPKFWGDTTVLGELAVTRPTLFR